METPKTQSEEWIALPGLFSQDEIAVTDLEIRTKALVFSQGRIYYGVYVREKFTEPKMGT